MVQVVVGVGHCGTKIVDEIYENKEMFELTYPIALNSEAQELMQLHNLKEDKWVGITGNGELVSTKGSIFGKTFGKKENFIFRNEVRGGFGNDPERAEEVINKNKDYFKNCLDAIFPGDKINYAYIFLGLGSGTGAGVSPEIAKYLKNRYPTTKVIAVGVMPCKSEGGRRAYAARYGMEQIAEFADSFILVDNERIFKEKNIELAYTKYNKFVANFFYHQIGGIFKHKIDPSKYSAWSGKVVDNADLLTATMFKTGNKRYVSAISSEPIIVAPKLRYILDKLKLGGLAGANIPTSDGMKKYFEDAVSHLTVTVEDLKNVEKGFCNLVIPDKLANKEIQDKVIRDKLAEICKTEYHFGASLTKGYVMYLNLCLTMNVENVGRLHEIYEMADKFKP